MCLVLILASLTVSGSWFLCKKAYISAKIFAQSGFDYDQLRRNQKLIGAALKARDILPPEAGVRIPFKRRGLSYVILQYSLFPHRITETSEFYLDGINRFPGNPSQWVQIPLSADASLYVRPDAVKRLLSPNASALPLPLLLVAALFFAGYNIVTGGFMLKALGLGLKEWGRLWYYVTAYLVGYFLSTALIWILMMLGMRLSPGSVLFVWGALAMLLGLPVSWSVEPREPVPPDRTGGLQAGGLLLAGLLSAATAGVFIATVSTGVFDWDGMSHWILKSKTVYHYQWLNFEHTHLNIYPLLWPLNIACQFAVLGGMHDELAKWTAGFCFIVFVVQILKALQVLGLRPAARYFAVLFFVVSAFHDLTKPWWYVQFTFANAENLFLAFWSALLTVVLAWIRNKDRSRYLWLAFILMAGLNLTKLEGMVATGILILTMLLLYRKIFFSPRAGTWLLAVFLSIGLPLGWMQWIHWQGFPSALAHFKEGLSLGKFMQLLRLNTRNYFSNNLPVYSLVLGFYVFAFRKLSRWLEPEIFLGIVSAGMVLFVWVAHSGSTAQDLSDIPPEVFPRLFLHAAPPLLLLFASRIARQSGCCQTVPKKDL